LEPFRVVAETRPIREPSDCRCNGRFRSVDADELCVVSIFIVLSDVMKDVHCLHGFTRDLSESGGRAVTSATNLTKAFWKRKWRLLLPGASEPRLRSANPSGLDFRYTDRLRGECDRSIVVVCNY